MQRRLGNKGRLLVLVSSGLAAATSKGSTHTHTHTRAKGCCKGWPGRPEKATHNKVVLWKGWLARRAGALLSLELTR